MKKFGAFDLKILIVSQYFYPENFRINDIVKELVDSGNSVTVLTGIPNYSQNSFFPGYDFFGPFSEDLFGAKVIRVPLLPRGKANFFRLFLNYFSFVFFSSVRSVFLSHEKFDRIFVFAPSPIFVCIPGIILKLINKSHLSIWILDLWPESLIATDVIRDGFLSKMIRAWVAKLYNFFDVLFVSSEGFKQNIKTYFDIDAPIVVLPNWLEDVYRTNNCTDDKTIDPSNNKVQTLVFAGNIGFFQGLDTMIEALAPILRSNPNLKVILAGDGRARDELERYVKQIGLAERVVFIGLKNPTELVEYLREASALLISVVDNHASFWTLPGKLQTYMGMGKPVLGIASGETKRVIEMSDCGYCAEAGDADGFKFLVNKFLTLSRSEQDNMGVNGRNYAEIYFQKRLIIGKLKSVLGID